MTINRSITGTNIFGSNVVPNCACEINHSFSIVYYVVRVVHKFGFQP